MGNDTDSPTWAEHMLKQVQDRVESIYTYADGLVQSYWNTHRHMRATHGKTEWGHYGVRARKRKWGVSIEWFENTFVGPVNRRKFRAKAIKRGRDNVRYRVERFPKAPAWERNRIIELETVFGYLRQELEILVRMAQLFQVIHVTEAAMFAGAIIRPETPAWTAPCPAPRIRKEAAPAPAKGRDGYELDEDGCPFIDDEEFDGGWGWPE